MERGKVAENWWDREAEAHEPEESVPMTLGRQSELFDDAGQAMVAPAAPATPAPKTVAAPVRPRAVVSVRSRSRSGHRVVATTRVEAVPRITSVTRSETAARGAVARQLVMSQSISSGREEARWFSVPRRVLLPRYQLFEGAEAVTEERGGLRLATRSMRTQRGHVWFV